ncbi:hypothetical protein CCAN12_760051 [Capnocytophaga canimorsus]|uniref:Uncharacterized protein n=1 Tax=Capnocytophaga canimorsus TaxID=28188 RepID=A0A0B7HL59_9FLAO|nr:hypothetical protein CCAN12_760051 [Capnocytophaga canimorsus]
MYDWQLKNTDLLNAIDEFNLVFLKQMATQYKNIKVLDINTFYQNQSQPFIDWRFFLLHKCL